VSGLSGQQGDVQRALPGEIGVEGDVVDRQVGEAREDGTEHVLSAGEGADVLRVQGGGVEEDAEELAAGA
jgi:hypothetical protein